MYRWLLLVSALAFTGGCSQSGVERSVPTQVLYALGPDTLSTRVPSGWVVTKNSGFYRGNERVLFQITNGPVVRPDELVPDIPGTGTAAGLLIHYLEPGTVFVYLSEFGGLGMNPLPGSDTFGSAHEEFLQKASVVSPHVDDALTKWGLQFQFQERWVLAVACVREPASAHDRSAALAVLKDLTIRRGAAN